MTTAMRLLGPVGRLLAAVRQERGLLWRSTLSMTLYQVATAATAALSAAVATAVLTGTSGRVVVTLRCGLGGAVVMVAVFTWVESWLSHVLAYRILDALRMRVYDAIERIVPARSGKRRTGEIAATAMADVESLEWFYAHTLGTGINAVVSPVVLSIALCVLVGPTGLIVPAGIVLLMAIPWGFAAVQARQGRQVRAALGELHAVAFEGADARRELATLGLEDYHRDQVLERTDAVQSAKLRASLRSAAEAALAEVVLAATSLGFLSALLTASAAGQVNPAVIPAAMVLVGAAVAPAAGAFAVAQRLGEISAAAARVLDIIDLAAEAEPDGIELPRGGAGHIQFDAVSFAYDDTTQVLRGMELTVPAGQSVALVGESGAGKTTIARLLTGLWPAAAGRILLDGVDIATVAPASLRREVALVAQQPFVFRGTVRSNLLLARPEADEEAMWRALHDAGLAEVVGSWSGGLDEPVGDRGATMSGGQRQRLSIAQVLLREPAVLILDESSAHLDALHESNLAEAVARLRHDRTTIVIAHRVTTIRRAGRVVMLDGGRVVADGTHETLLETYAPYRTLIGYDDAPDGAG